MAGVVVAAGVGLQVWPGLLLCASGCRVGNEVTGWCCCCCAWLVVVLRLVLWLWLVAASVLLCGRGCSCGCRWWFCCWWCCTQFGWCSSCEVTGRRFYPGWWWSCGRCCCQRGDWAAFLPLAGGGAAAGFLREGLLRCLQLCRCCQQGDRVAFLPLAGGVAGAAMLLLKLEWLRLRLE